MGNLFSRVINYFYSNNSDIIIYSNELCTQLPVSQNNVYKENKIIEKNQYYENELIIF